jgi:alkylated DNA repair dioxygenase AlkB
MLSKRFEDYPFQHFPEYYSENNLFEKVKNECNFTFDKVYIGEDKVERLEKRGTCWLSDIPDLEFEYSGKKMKPQKIPKTIEKIKNLIYKDFGINFDGILVNYYENGGVGMGYHSDPIEDKWDNNFIIYSLGDKRKLIFREKENKDVKINFDFKNGDLLYMYDDCQKIYEHSIRENKSDMPRISLVFKSIIF